MNETFLYVAIFAIAAMFVNSIGIWIIYQKVTWVENVKEYFMCFAAGVLIASPLIMAFPQAVQKNSNAGLAALVGFLFMFLSNKYIKLKTQQKELAFGITALEGIGIHSLIDGVIYSVTFSVSIFTGVLTGIGLVAHELAEGIIVFSVLLNSGIQKKKAVVFAFFVAGLTTPIGAFVAFPFVSRLKEENLGLFLGFVTGVLIYVSAAHLLPEASEYEKKHSVIAFLIGIGLALFLKFSKG